MDAATAMTIIRSVVRIGEIPFLDFNILFKRDFTSTAKASAVMIFNKYEDRILIQSSAFVALFFTSINLSLLSQLASNIKRGNNVLKVRRARTTLSSIEGTTGRPMLLEIFCRTRMMRPPQEPL